MISGVSLEKAKIHMTLW